MSHRTMLLTSLLARETPNRIICLKLFSKEVQKKNLQTTDTDSAILGRFKSNKQTKILFLPFLACFFNLVLLCYCNIFHTPPPGAGRARLKVKPWGNRPKWAKMSKNKGQDCRGGPRPTLRGLNLYAFYFFFFLTSM